jgi:hypothetical protein
MERKSKKISVLLAAIVVFSYSGCQKKENCEFLEMPVFGINDQPYICFDTNRVNIPECEYSTVIDLWADTLHFFSPGFVRKNGQKILLRTNKSSYVDFLDFDVAVGKSYEVQLPEQAREFGFTVLVESRFFSSDRSVYVNAFRIKDCFFYEGVKLDVVLLASLENGILGSHLVMHDSREEQSNEYFLHPKGSVFLEERGLNGREFRKIR